MVRSDAEKARDRATMTTLAQAPTPLVERLAEALLAALGAVERSPEEYGEAAGKRWRLARMQRRPDPDWRAASEVESKAAALRAYALAERRRTV